MVWIRSSTRSLPAPGFRHACGSAALEADVVGLLARLGAVEQSADTGVALFIDELQDARTPALAALSAAMHRAAQDVTPIALVGAGEVAIGADFSSSGEASQVREELITKGIVCPPRRGQIAFTVPKFDRFAIDHLERDGA